MGKILTVAIHKGGTGKTTLVSHLALYARSKKLSVLIIDMDAQGNISAFFNVESPTAGASALFLEGQEAPMHSIDGEDFKLIPADNGLLGIERLPFESVQLYRQRLRSFAATFDLVILDTPPSMGFSMLAPLIASDFAVAPVIPDAYSIRGVKSLYAKIKAVRSKHNPSLKFLGLVLNRWNSRNSQQVEMVKKFQELLPGQLIANPLADRSAIANAAYDSKAVWDKPNGGAARVAAVEMLEVMAEIMEKMGMRNKG
ncbi:ParA family protein [Candidatus Thiothrix sp. Deng01]|uniref:ParA family protein n=1 Tax=Candidatus Thiothrix phosphatis TaxID=3112415 RepID=A0ABU6D144_9GAMM|nr:MULTISPECIES: ParA family protein [Thiothrix]MEB4592566.1 ParA family protein [Candidatus Thiothrix sp. Deng01]